MRLPCLALAAALTAIACGESAPGEEEFQNANRQISVHNDETAFGNGPEAVKLAVRFSAVMKAMRRLAFTQTRNKGPSLSDGEFLTYCQLTDDGVLFLVHVPELRNFTEDAQASLLELGWVAAQSTAKGIPGARDLKLGVGLRGALLYGGQAIGTRLSEKPDYQDSSTPVELERFYPFFLGAYPASIQVDATR